MTALRDNMPKTRFTVTYEEHYCGNALDDILYDDGGIMETALALGDKITGEDDGARRCAAQWGPDGRKGVLMHRRDDEALCAFIPLPDKTTADREHRAALALAALARAVKDTPILLERGIPREEHRLAALLERLSEALET